MDRGVDHFGSEYMQLIAKTIPQPFWVNVHGGRLPLFAWIARIVLQHRLLTSW
jgi:hypothetical protein